MSFTFFDIMINILWSKSGVFIQENYFIFPPGFSNQGAAFPEFISVEGKKMEYADPELAAGNASFHYRVR